MPSTTEELRQEVNWNVLTDRWLEVMNLDAEAEVCSPLDVMNRAAEIRCIAVASPLDLFAAHRFLLTLLYWKAHVAGGVPAVRGALLGDEVPRTVLDAIGAEAHCFRLFDDETPFLQDPAARDDMKKGKTYSAGSFFAEFASGTNIAHFHHGDDERMRVCVRCATVGMLRVVPWSQAGGQGKTPSVHGAPPIMAFASGKTLAHTLGTNLVPLATTVGAATWFGHFKPTNKNAQVPHLEALTWNPRRIILGSPARANVCWRCGLTGIAAVGPIVYLKNEKTKKRSDKKLFEWQDPSAFHSAEAPYKTMKSWNGAYAVNGRDLDSLLNQEGLANAAVVAENPGHEGWHVVIPCTNPANNKTFDHRQLELPSFSPDAVRSALPARVSPPGPQGLDGWTEPRRAASAGGATRFVRAAARLLTDADWADLSAAAYRQMHDAPAAFDILCGLYWALRDKGKRLPSRSVAWLVLKLMATVPARARVPHAGATFCPLRSRDRFLPKRQHDECRKGNVTESIYPVSFPRGNRLEASLRNALDSHLRQRTPEPIDWADLCHALDRLLD